MTGAGMRAMLGEPQNEQSTHHEADSVMRVIRTVSFGSRRGTFTIAGGRQRELPGRRAFRNRDSEKKASAWSAETSTRRRGGTARMLSIRPQDGLPKTHRHNRAHPARVLRRILTACVQDTPAPRGRLGKREPREAHQGLCEAVHAPPNQMSTVPFPLGKQRRGS
jgi:hypothetical protein